MTGPEMASRETSLVPIATAVDTFSLDHSLVIHAQASSGEAESFRALRTHVIARHVQTGRRAIAVCAIAPHAGCTFVAANLAVALAQVGLKVLLIDANMRSPGIDGIFKPSTPMVGLAQCMGSYGPDYGEFIQHSVLPNLSLMFSGGIQPNAQELLATDRFEELMSYCLRDYDMTILDTPPASGCSDAIRVSNVVGYSMIVTRRNRTLVSDVRTLIAELESDSAQVIGTVLTEF